jgi:hypothetical protein
MQVFTICWCFARSFSTCQFFIVKFPFLQHSVTTNLAFVPIAPMSAARLLFGKRRCAKITHPAHNRQTVSTDKVVRAHILYPFLTSASAGGERPLYSRERTLVCGEYEAGWEHQRKTLRTPYRPSLSVVIITDCVVPATVNKVGHTLTDHLAVQI